MIGPSLERPVADMYQIPVKGEKAVKKYENL